MKINIVFLLLITLMFSCVQDDTDDDTDKEQADHQSEMNIRNQKIVRDFAHSVEQSFCGRPECIPRIIASVKPGVYDEFLTVDFTCDAETDGEKFFCTHYLYTLDGSDPDLNNLKHSKGKVGVGKKLTLELKSAGNHTIKIVPFFGGANFGTAKKFNLASFNYSINTNPSSTIILDEDEDELAPGEYFGEKSFRIRCDECVGIAYTLKRFEYEEDSEIALPSFDYQDDSDSFIIEDTETDLIELTTSGKYILSYISKDDRGNLEMYIIRERISK